MFGVTATHLGTPASARCVSGPVLPRKSALKQRLRKRPPATSLLRATDCGDRRPAVHAARDLHSCSKATSRRLAQIRAAVCAESAIPDSRLPTVSSPRWV